METALKLSQGLVVVAVQKEGELVGSDVQREIRVSGSSACFAAGTGAADIQLQQSARGVPGVSWAGDELRVRSGNDRSRPGDFAGERGDRGVAEKRQADEHFLQPGAAAVLPGFWDFVFRCRSRTFPKRCSRF